LQIANLNDVDIAELNTNAKTFVAACGYEARASALARGLGASVKNRFAIAFEEWPAALSRVRNEQIFKECGFTLVTASANSPDALSRTVVTAIDGEESTLPLAIDISCMTRPWHGAVVRTIANLEIKESFDTYIAYVPGRFSPPRGSSPANEIVAPVDGFASMALPDLPVAAILGLGYEKERALGLQQLLDPERTILMIPRNGRTDKYYPLVVKSNKDILERTQRDWRFEYPLDQPSATFGMMASLVSGLLPSYRVVLASLGPKLFGMLCFLLATQFRQVSVWRVSSGIHAIPRETHPDTRNTSVLRVTWAPTISADS
jgi:hypothetical protein